jgi:hypothetical protein
MSVFARLFLASVCAIVAILVSGTSSVHADAFARWDRVDGRGSWTTGWIRQTPAQYGVNINRCGHFHSACRCPGRGSYCGWYNPGSVTGFFADGCNRPAWAIRCTVQPHTAAAPNTACINAATYNYQRCRAGGTADTQCRYEHKINMSRC